MRRLRNQQGTSLVDALAAMVILAIGLVGVIGCLTMALQTDQKAKYMEKATATAQDTVEMMRSQGFGNITTAEFPPTDTVSNLPSGTQTIAITYPYNGNANLKKVVVTISWHSTNNSTSHVSLVTVVTNRTSHIGA
jgi:type II secretory pathway pseudopilin PulG